MSIIEQIKEQIDIVELVREYIPGLKKVGNSYNALCPFHDEKKPSFYVSKQRNMFHCFGCDAGGDAITFVMKIENITFGEAVNKLAKRLGIKVVTYEEDSGKSISYKILQDVADFYHDILVSSELAADARNYLAKRGINKETIEKFLIGYAPDGNVVLGKFKKDYSIDELYKAGVINISEQTNQPYDYVHSRIIFPIHNQFGRIVGFGGRILKHDEDVPLYLNTPDTALFSKGKTLYGLFYAKNAIVKQNQVILVEGYMDVLMAHQFGFENVVAPLGTAFTMEQAKLIEKFTRNIFIAFDPDESGIRASIRAGEICVERGMNVKVVSIPDSLDLDEYLLKYGSEKFVNLIHESIDFFSFMVRNFRTQHPEDKRAAVLELLPVLQRVSSPIAKHEAIVKISRELGIKEDVLSAELESLRKRRKADYEPMTEITSKNLFSTEEEFIIFSIIYPDALNCVTGDLFADEKTRKVISLMKDKKYAKLQDMFSDFDEEMSNWFRRLLFESEKRAYNSPQKTLNLLVKELNIKKLERMRDELKKEIEIMLEKKQKDMEKIRRYNEISKILKSIGGK